MVGDIVFSSGGFDAKYGDKMSSVLDIRYKKPQEFGGNVSLGLLGASVHLEGLIGSRFTYQMGYRRKTNKYLLNSLETQGEYNPTFNDFQVYLTYDLNEKAEMAFLGNIADNQYNFIPENRETSFGNFYEMLKLKVYFDGQELDRFSYTLIILSYLKKRNFTNHFIIFFMKFLTPTHHLVKNCRHFFKGNLIFPKIFPLVFKFFIPFNKNYKLVF